MKSRGIPLWLSIIGGLLLLPGALWLAGSRTRVDNDDAWIALQPLARVPLDRINNGPFAVALIVPTRQGGRGYSSRGRTGVRHQRDTLDKQEYDLLVIIARADRIERADGKGRPSTTGHRTLRLLGSLLSKQSAIYCRSWRRVYAEGYEYRSAPGSAGDLSCAGLGEHQGQTCGVGLDDETKVLVKWLTVVGFLFVLPGASLIIRNHVRQHRVD